MPLPLINPLAVLAPLQHSGKTLGCIIFGAITAVPSLAAKAPLAVLGKRKAIAAVQIDLASASSAPLLLADTPNMSSRAVFLGRYVRRYQPAAIFGQLDFLTLSPCCAPV